VQIASGSQPGIPAAVHLMQREVWITKSRSTVNDTIV
jgi:hypothetical protein